MQIHPGNGSLPAVATSRIGGTQLHLWTSECYFIPFVDEKKKRAHLIEAVKVESPAIGLLWELWVMVPKSAAPRRRKTMHKTKLQELSPVGQERQFFPPAQHWGGHIRSSGSSAGTPV